VLASRPKSVNWHIAKLARRQIKERKIPARATLDNAAYVFERLIEAANRVYEQ